jgi:hypothetical protein
VHFEVDTTTFGQKSVGKKTWGAMLGQGFVRLAFGQDIQPSDFPPNDIVS